MSSEVAIRLRGISKSFNVYARPVDRLYQALLEGLVKIIPVEQLRNRLVNHAHGLAHQHHALSDISVEIRKGETVGVIGRNGSGKSTLLQIICGTLNPSVGQVEVNGRVAALLELGSGFDPEFTGRENVYMNAQLHGLTRKQIDSRFTEIENFAGIGEFIDQPVKSYSSGMYVRLAFAVIANIDAEILIIDEALAVGDAVFSQKCIRFLLKFKERGTLIFVSHDSASVLNLCDRALWIDRGRVHLDGKVSDVMKLYHASTLAEMAKQIRMESNLLLPEDALKIRNSNLSWNEINSASGFNPTALSTGQGKAKIISAGFLGSDGGALTTIDGGARVLFISIVEFIEDIDSVLFGFSCKNKRGEIVFGENLSEFLKSKLPSAKSGEVIKFVFSFRLPLLMTGDYVIDLAVAEGTQDSHVQQHWIYDALTIAINTNIPVYGLLALETSDVHFEYV